jgi:hypothetical protein
MVQHPTFSAPAAVPMQDSRGRVLLCALALGICTFQFFPSGSAPASAAHGSGRVLLSVDTSSLLASLLWMTFSFASRALLILSAFLLLLRDPTSDDLPPMAVVRPRGPQANLRRKLLLALVFGLLLALFYR